MKIIGVLVVCALAAGCGKKDPKAERDEICRVAKQTFVKGMNDQIAKLEGSADESQKNLAEAFRSALANAEPRFDAFCHSLTEDEMTCVENMPGAMTDSKCAPTVEKVKTQLFGL